jgi:hypothetical protein
MKRLRGITLPAAALALALLAPDLRAAASGAAPDGGPASTAPSAPSPGATADAPGTPAAQDPAGMRPRGKLPIRAEDRLLPQECLFTNGTAHSMARPDIYRSLLARYGDGWSHMHHYCNALRQSLEYNRHGTTTTRRRDLARRMVVELDYVIRQSPPDFPLLPMVMLRRLDTLRLVGRSREAFDSTVEFVERFPDLAEGHARLAWELRRAGRAAEADAVLGRARGIVTNPAELDAALQRLAALN